MVRSTNADRHHARNLHISSVRACGCGGGSVAGDGGGDGRRCRLHPFLLHLSFPNSSSSRPYSTRPQSRNISAFRRQFGLENLCVRLMLKPKPKESQGKPMEFSKSVASGPKTKSNPKANPIICERGPKTQRLCRQLGAASDDTVVFPAFLTRRFFVVCCSILHETFL